MEEIQRQPGHGFYIFGWIFSVCAVGLIIWAVATKVAPDPRSLSGEAIPREELSTNALTAQIEDSIADLRRINSGADRWLVEAERRESRRAHEVARVEAAAQRRSLLFFSGVASAVLAVICFGFLAVIRRR